MRKRITVALFLVILAAALFIAWRRYTDLGVFIGGGGRYWVDRATRTTNDLEARAHLQRVVSATNYGVNTAENAVRRLPRREDRVRMWRLLIEIAPNENWRGIYRRDLSQEGPRHEPPPN